MEHEDLVLVLSARADVLTARSVADACTGAFWEERFGERGRRHILADAQHHIQELCLALKFALPSTMAHYARWLQSVLTNRGMCSLHLSEHFIALAEAIRTENLVGGERAIGYIQAAVEALRYDQEPAQTVQDAMDALADDVLATLSNKHPNWFDRWNEDGRTRARRDALYLLSYLADAIALEKPEVFARYVSWIAGFYRRRERPAEYLVEVLAALDRALERLQVDARAIARRTLTSGREALTESAGP